MLKAKRAKSPPPPDPATVRSSLLLKRTTELGELSQPWFPYAWMKSLCIMIRQRSVDRDVAELSVQAC